MGDFSSGTKSAPNAGGTLLAANAIEGLSSFAGGYSNAQAYGSQGAYQGEIADLNATFSELQAKDALKRGDKAASDQRKGVKELVGAQRASLAAQGINIDSGSALDVQENTRTLGALDSITIKNNAFKEAMGYRMQGLGYEAQGNYARIAAAQSARSSLLTGGLSAIGSGLKFKAGFNTAGSASSNPSINNYRPLGQREM